MPSDDRALILDYLQRLESAPTPTGWTARRRQRSLIRKCYNWLELEERLEERHFIWRTIVPAVTVPALLTVAASLLTFPGHLSWQSVGLRLLGTAAVFLPIGGALAWAVTRAARRDSQALLEDARRAAVAPSSEAPGLESSTVKRND